MLPSLIPLDDNDWKQINSELPDTASVINRVMKWTPAEWINLYDAELLKRIRLSRVRFNDSIEKLRNARYALAQAIGIRKYYLDKKENEEDKYHISADWLSRFYADYVPLQLASAADHSLDALLDLYDLREDINQFTGKYRLKRMRNCFEAKMPGSSIEAAIMSFDEFTHRREIWGYRDDWVHNKAPRVETILYNPPYIHDVIENRNEQWQEIGIGYIVPFDYAWEDFIGLLKEGLTHTITFIAQSTKEWENIYNNAKK